MQLTNEGGKTDIQVVYSQEIEQTNCAAIGVSHIYVETVESGDDFSCVLCLWDHQSQENTFIDLKFNCKLIDRQLIETMHKVHD